jgi:hypothetical protein
MSAGGLTSFDVFDTLLVRKVGRPEAAFGVVGARAVEAGLWGGSAERFGGLREGAEAMARKGCGVKEVTLEGIYGVLVQWGTIRAETAARLAALELEVEEELLEVNPVRAKQLGEERRKGRAIAFVSDMYVPEGWLRRQLEIRGLMEDGDGLYCSSARGMTKRSGELFGKVLSETGRSAGEVLHVGDHEVADVAVPRGLGMGAEQVRETRLTPYEEILESFGVQTGGVTTVMAGMSRLVRLRDEAEHGHEGEGGGLGAVTCGVAGPILSAYVLWVLRKAREDGLEALYFLARDGQILLEVAKVLAPLGGYEGRMGYLHVSRQALRLPGVDHEVPDLGWIGERAGEFTVRELLARAELVPEMVPGVLGRHGFPVDAVDRVVGADGVERFGLVLKDPELVAVVVGQSRATRELLIGYLRGQGLMDGGVKRGVVDLGWHGTLQRALDRVCRQAGVPGVRGYYFGLGQRGGNGGCGVARAYFFDDAAVEGVGERSYWVEPVMEIFCTGDHGSTRGYRREGERVEPVLLAAVNEGAMRWGLRRHQEMVVRFAEGMAKVAGVEWRPEELMGCLDELLKRFWNRPSDNDARAWGAYPYSDDQLEQRSVPWGEGLTWRNVVAALVRGVRRGNHGVSWAAGAEANASRAARWVLKAGRRVRRGVR